MEAATDAIELAKIAIIQKEFNSGLTWAKKAEKLNLTLTNSVIKKDQALVLADLYSQLQQLHNYNNYTITKRHIHTKPSVLP